MPLSTGTTKAAREENIKREVSAGKPVKQAVAIAYHQQRSNAAKKGARSKDAAVPREDAIATLIRDIYADIELLLKVSKR